MAEVFVKALRPEDWEIYRNVRVRAVNMHTGVYLADPERVAQYPKEFWLNGPEGINGADRKVFCLFDEFNTKSAIGIGGVFTWKGDTTGQTGVVAMGFIEPEYRGQSYSDLLFKARIDFAKAHTSWKKLITGYREGNEPARKTMEKHGFQYAFTEDMLWPDGAEAKGHNYLLDLEELRLA